MSFIIGKKIGMSQMFQEDGKVTTVTVIEAGPIYITQVKTKETDGYDSVQVGFGETKKVHKAKAGHLKKSSTPNLKVLREFRTETAHKEVKDMKLGDKIDAATFNIGDLVKVQGTAKGKGFQGVVKRHNFAGAPASHGHHKVLRHPGSIGQRFPQHTLKGLRMAGRDGGRSSTTRGLKIVSVDVENNTIAVSGPVPGRRGTLLEITTQ